MFLSRTIFRHVKNQCQMFCRQFALNSKEILSEENKIRCLKKLSSYKGFTGNKSVGMQKRAAVFVPLCQYNGELCLLYTVRSSNLRANRSQIAFPGGMQDAVDMSLEETALRETKEEIGISRESIEIWGPGPAVGRDTLLITPYLGFIKNFNPNMVVLNKDEVTEVFTTSLQFLSDNANFRSTRFRENSFLSTLPVYLTPEHKIWGFTAVITHLTLTSLIPDFYQNKLSAMKTVNTELPRIVFAGFIANFFQLLLDNYKKPFWRNFKHPYLFN